MEVLKDYSSISIIITLIAFVTFYIFSTGLKEIVERFKFINLDGKKHMGVFMLIIYSLGVYVGHSNKGLNLYSTFATSFVLLLLCIFSITFSDRTKKKLTFRTPGTSFHN
jgi:hypothetical protein